MIPKRWRAGALAVLILFLLVYPLVASSFFILQIGFQSLFLAIVAASLIFLANYGGMLSLAQTALYGVAGYTLAVTTITYGWPWYAGIAMALACCTLFAFLVGLVSVRTQGIYFLMITLAIAMLCYFYAEQDRNFTNGHSGIYGVQPPGGALSAHPAIYYYMALATAALVYAGLRYVVRSPFGLALQGVRDNPRRMRSLGFYVEAHRVAAFTLGGFVAGIGGVLGVWYNGAISPGSIDLTRTINVLVVAVVGGLGALEGALVGAVFFTLVTNFASNFTDRFNTVIGLAFLAVALFSPDGIMGLPRTIQRLRFRRAGRKAGHRHGAFARTGTAAMGADAGTGSASLDEGGGQ